MAIAAGQFTSLTNTNTTPAIALVIIAKTFLTALTLARDSDSPMPKIAINKTPWAAPKYPP